MHFLIVVASNFSRTLTIYLGLFLNHMIRTDALFALFALLVIISLPGADNIHALASTA
jgi:hypothetical protein